MLTGKVRPPGISSVVGRLYAAAIWFSCRMRMIVFRSVSDVLQKNWP